MYLNVSLKTLTPLFLPLWKNLNYLKDILTISLFLPMYGVFVLLLMNLFMINLMTLLKINSKVLFSLIKILSIPITLILLKETFYSNPGETKKLSPMSGVKNKVSFLSLSLPLILSDTPLF
jgi:hypothetical protein